ncbi:hypothetical protein KCP75_11515 [Salmonella enterica subsp. enterica]|nr:hypothetical protein KCP75_11515 [Salmonella enterica subsp. enterica]
MRCGATKIFPGRTTSEQYEDDVHGIEIGRLLPVGAAQLFDDNAPRAGEADGRYWITCECKRRALESCTAGEVSSNSGL